jgi:hypothetical protein
MKSTSCSDSDFFGFGEEWDSFEHFEDEDEA